MEAAAEHLNHLLAEFGALNWSTSRLSLMFLHTVSYTSAGNDVANPKELKITNGRFGFAFRLFREHSSLLEEVSCRNILHLLLLGLII